MLQRLSYYSLYFKEFMLKSHYKFITIVQAHAQRQALAAHPETQEHLLEIITPILAVPIGRPGRAQPCDRAGLLLIGPLQGDRGRILMEPGGREGIDGQGVEGDGPKHAVEICAKQRLEKLAEAVSVQRHASQAILEQGEHPALLQACPHLIEGMRAIENSEEQGLHATATREDMRGVRRTEGIDEGSHVELADHSQHQRQVGHGPDLLNRNRHEVPPLQVWLEGAS